MLGGDVHVAEATFEAAARVGCGRPGSVEHQVHGLCRALGRVGARRPACRLGGVTASRAPWRRWSQPSNPPDDNRSQMASAPSGGSPSAQGWLRPLVTGRRR